MKFLLKSKFQRFLPSLEEVMNEKRADNREEEATLRDYSSGRFWGDGKGIVVLPLLSLSSCCFLCEDAHNFY